MIERHGHIIATGSGLRARCGGPALCSVCLGELLDLAERLAAAIKPFLRDGTAMITVGTALQEELEVVLLEARDQ